MTIALATRGYLWPLRQVTVQCGPGPTIVGAQEAQPQITGGLKEVAEGPTITGAVTPGPTISTTSSTTQVGDEAPSISGADKPKLG